MAEVARVMELAERLLVGRVPFAEQHSATLTLGSLPAPLPLELPLPTAAHVRASVVTRQGDKPRTIDVLLEAPDPESVIGFYRREMRARQWQQSPVHPAWPFAKGDAFPQVERDRAAFCASGDGPRLLVYSLEDRRGELHLHVDMTGSGLCRSPHQFPSSRLPLLPLPARLPWVQPIGSSGGTSRDSTGYEGSAARTFASMAAGELESYFARLLQEAEWVRLSGGATFDFACSSWRVPGDDLCLGMLFVWAPSEDRRLVRIDIQPGIASS